MIGTSLFLEIKVALEEESAPVTMADSMNDIPTYSKDSDATDIKENLLVKVKEEDKDEETHENTQRFPKMT